MLFKDCTKIVETDSVYTQLVPTCSELLKAGHITVVKSVTVDNSIMDILIRAGYKVAVIEVETSSLFCYNAIKAKQLKEESKLVVAIGEDFAVECGKLIAGCNNVPAILIPTDFSALCAMQRRAEFFVEEGELATYIPKEPSVVIFCRNYLLTQSPRKLSLGLGYILSYLVWAFDTLYENIIHNRKSGDRLVRILEKILAFCRDLNTLELSLNAESILKLALEISELVNEHEVLSTSSNLLAWLISLYKKQKVSYNNYGFVASFLILEMYKNIAFMDNMLIPANRNKTLQKLADLCGFDYGAALTATKIGYAEDHNRRCFVTLDYIKELQALLEGDWLDKVARYYRRLQGSSGYSLRKTITSEELLMLVALAGEECDGYPLLKHLQITGLLERYIT